MILLIALFLGVDPGPALQQPVNQPQSQPGFDLSKCKTGADANKYAECRVVATGNSLDGIWSQLLRVTAGRGRNCSPARYRPVAGQPPAMWARSTAGRPNRLLRRRFLRCPQERVRIQRWPVGAGVCGRPRIRAPRSEPARRPRPCPEGLRVPAGAVCVPSCRPIAMPGCGPTTRRSLSNPVPT